MRRERLKQLIQEADGGERSSEFINKVALGVKEHISNTLHTEMEKRIATTEQEGIHDVEEDIKEQEEKPAMSEESEIEMPDDKEEVEEMLQIRDQQQEGTLL